MGCSMTSVEASQGYDPIALAAATEKVVVDGNKRKYVQLGRALRFYGGTSSATEVGCNLRCKFCFSDKPVWKPKSTGRFYSPEQVFTGLTKSAEKHGHKLISASASEGYARAGSSNSAARPGGGDGLRLHLGNEWHDFGR